MDNYLYHCRGCQKPDKEYPDKEVHELDEQRRQVGRRKIPVEYHMWARADAYGIYTGLYCDDCYENNYPYRRDEYYDPAYAGERMEPDE